MRGREGKDEGKGERRVRRRWTGVLGSDELAGERAVRDGGGCEGRE